MKKLYFAVVLLFAIVFNVSAQQTVDIIYLKNGSRVKGTVIEHIPNVGIKLQTSDGSLFVFKTEEIEKMEKESVQNQATTPAVSEESTKLMLYQSGKRTPMLGCLLTDLIPSAGHAYAGNWGRGLIFAGAEVALYLYALTGMKEVNTQGYYQYTEYEYNSTFYYCMAGALIVRIWEHYDAYKEVERYNAKLYEQIMGKPMPGNLSFRLKPFQTPQSNQLGFGVGIAYKF